MDRKVKALADGLTEGICAHLVLMSRTGIWPVYSEYVLYETVLRIARNLQWEVACEYKLPKRKAGAGDHRRIDFVFSLPARKLAIPLELKWFRNPSKHTPVTEDIKKLRQFRDQRGFRVAARWLAVAGRHILSQPGQPLLRSRLKLSNYATISVTALGSAGSARGMSIFEIPAISGSSKTNL